MEKCKACLTMVLGCVALGALGIVSYLVLADVICPFTGTLCEGTDKSEVIHVQPSSTSGTTSTITLVQAKDGNDHIIVASNITSSIQLDGQEGNDVIFDAKGGSSTKPLDGGPGNDLIYGNGGTDTIHGGSGNDRIDGGTGNDTIHGNEGNDWIQGGLGDDIIDGGPGNDVIDPGPGRDGSAAPTATDTDSTTSGGGGNDIFILRQGESGDSTEYLLCTTNSSDRGLVRLVSFSKDDPTLPHELLNRSLTDPTLTSYATIQDGSTSAVFRIYYGPGSCRIVLSSR